MYQQFLDLALHEPERVTMGYSRDPSSMFDVGPITDPRQLKVIETHLADALERGARILTGGEINGNFVSPTVLVDVTHEMRLMREETFGPLMPIVKVSSEAEAIALANDNAFGLGASVWSRDLSCVASNSRCWTSVPPRTCSGSPSGRSGSCWSGGACPSFSCPTGDAGSSAPI